MRGSAIRPLAPEHLQLLQLLVECCERGEQGHLLVGVGPCSARAAGVLGLFLRPGGAGRSRGVG